MERGILHKCELFCQSHGLSYKRNLIMEAYMAMGGIPYYWSFLKKGLSVAQNFDRMFFDEDGELAGEYDALYASLFKNPTVHIKVINALSVKKAGMRRSGLTSGSDTHTIHSQLTMDDLFG